MVSEFAILAQKWSQIASREKNYCWVFANHPAVHSGGVRMGTCDTFCFVSLLLSAQIERFSVFVGRIFVKYV